MVVCLGQLMMVVDMTIVNVALPVIQRDLRFSQADLTWVVDAYLISYGSFLLLAGRLGDLVGRKRVFLSGLTLFTARLGACGFADSQLHADRRPLHPGPRRRDRHLGDHRPDRHRLPAPGRAREGDERLHVRRHLRRLARAAARRRARPVASTGTGSSSSTCRSASPCSPWARAADRARPRGLGCAAASTSPARCCHRRDDGSPSTPSSPRPSTAGAPRTRSGSSARRR